jgi:hypothetical protein
MEHEINFNSDSSFVRIKSGEKQAKTADNIIANLPLALALDSTDVKYLHHLDTSHENQLVNKGKMHFDWTIHRR